MKPSIRLDQCLWVRSPTSEHGIYTALNRTLAERGTRVFSLRLDANGECVAKLKDLLWKSDEHVILQVLHPKELKALRPIFEPRKNFSIVLADWWAVPYWFTQNAERVFHHLYTGIAVRTRGFKFANDWSPPLFSWPEAKVPYEFACSALRPLAVLARPFRDAAKHRERQAEPRDPSRLVYFPIPVSEKELPLRIEPPEYDFSSTGATSGFYITRDAYAPSRYDFANLYCDRQRLINLILQYEGNPYKVLDRRRIQGRPSWEEYCRINYRSRFAVASGGVHFAAIPKYLEYACFGTPMIGVALPFEYPWLKDCLFPIDNIMNIQPREFRAKLDEAFAVQPKLRENCLALREPLLKLYDPSRILDMVQAQIEGAPVAPGYLVEMKGAN